jgi:selenocysteine lyase/cysteine desulfurase
MSPRGSAFLAMSERLQDRLRPINAGWYAGADVHTSYYGPPLRLATDARRSDRFRAGLGLLPGGSANVSTTVDGAREKLERAGIRAATRAGALRASFHLYSTEADVDAALTALVG